MKVTETIRIQPCDWLPKTPIYKSKLKRWLARWFAVQPDGWDEQAYLVGDTAYVSRATYEKLGPLE